MSLDWDTIRDILKHRRFRRDMQRKGYRNYECDWEINRGNRWQEVITHVVIDLSGKSVWTKIGVRSEDVEQA